MSIANSKWIQELSERIEELKVQRDSLLEAAQQIDEAFDLDDLSNFTEHQQKALGAVTLAIAEANGDCEKQPLSPDRKFSWVVRFDVDLTWVEDGFNLTDERALGMLSKTLGWANVDTELGAKVLEAPDDSEIRKAQGYES